MLQHIIEWLGSHMGTCTFHEQTGVVCPGCGFQRAFVALLEGDLLQSFILFPALLPLAAMFIFLGLHLSLNFRHGALILKIMYITNTSVIILNFLIKLIITLKESTSWKHKRARLFLPLLKYPSPAHRGS